MGSQISGWDGAVDLEEVRGTTIVVGEEGDLGVEGGEGLGDWLTNDQTNGSGVLRQIISKELEVENMGRKDITPIVSLLKSKKWIK